MAGSSLSTSALEHFAELGEAWRALGALLCPVDAARETCWRIRREWIVTVDKNRRRAPEANPVRLLRGVDYEVHRVRVDARSQLGQGGPEPLIGKSPVRATLEVAQRDVHSASIATVAPSKRGRGQLEISGASREVAC